MNIINNSNFIIDYHLVLSLGLGDFYFKYNREEG